MISRRAFLSTTATIAAAAAAPGAPAQGRPEKSRIAMSVGGKAALYHLPLTIAEQLGYFKAEGVTVEIIDCPDATRAQKALVEGPAQVSAGAFAQVVGLQARGQMFQSFVLQARAPQIAMGVSTRTLPGYRALADLKGRRIGVCAPGSLSNLVASMVLARAGLKVDDVSFVGVGEAAGALAALRTGQIDAISNTDPVMTMLEQKGDVKTISDTRTLKGTQELFGGPMPAGCLYASADFIRQNPNTCQALAHAVVHALKWLQTAGPGDILKAVPETYLLGDRSLYLASFDKMRESISLDGLVPADGAPTALRAVAAFDGNIKAEKIDPARLYTNEFARRAKDRFKA